MLEPTQNMPAIVDSYQVDTDSEPQANSRVLKRKQVKAANLLGYSMSQREVARIVGVSEWTMSHWCKIPEFQDLVIESARQDIADIRATKNRSTRTAWQIIEAKLAGKGEELTREQVDIAREIGRATL